MSDQSTREAVVLIVAVVLGAAILIAVTAVCIVEMIDSDRDTSAATKALGSVLSALAFGVAGYMLGIVRSRNGKAVG